MRFKKRLFCFLTVLSFLSLSPAYASYGTFAFEDERFQGDYSTENLDRIIQEYELYDSWYWTTAPFIVQTFHGAENAPGWTDTSVIRRGGNGYKKNTYGCRWLSNKVIPELPKLGYGECFGFAQFIGYLLSGEYNLYKNWKVFRNLDAAGGLKPGDVFRTEFEAKGKKYAHSAVVYSVSETEILFMQVSGGTYNRIYVGTGFQDGYHNLPTTAEEISKIPNFKICRSPDNCNTD